MRDGKLRRIVSMGGGPAGLYAAILLKKALPKVKVEVYERNRPQDTFGWGVVFSDKTMAGFEAADSQSHAQIVGDFHHWDDIDVHIHGQTIRSGGHGFCGIERKRLLNILQQRGAELGVQQTFEYEVTDEAAFADADLLIAADGVNSRTREQHAAVLEPNVDVRKCRFIWLGTTQRFPAFTFAFERTEHGWFQIHAYQFSRDLSTVIVETREETWLAHGLDKADTDASIAFCEQLFGKYLGGAKLLSNARHLRGSAWLNFKRVLCRRWFSDNLVLIGDAAHTAHFSIGSGTKLAMEDAIALSREVVSGAPVREALARYQQERELEALKLQSAARNRMEWFENVARYTHLQPLQFTYSLLTGSQRIGHANLKLRDGGFVEQVERHLAESLAQSPDRSAGPDVGQNVDRSAGRSGAPSSAQRVDPDSGRSGCVEGPRPPMFLPFRLRGLALHNRVVVSPMAQYSALEGVPGDWHLVHYGARATGGAGLVVTEMTCVSPQGRITPGCTGLWNEAQGEAWSRITSFVHGNSQAKICLQLGHSGRKGSTQVGWEQADHPLPEGNWPLLSASPLPYLEGISQTPAEASEADIHDIVRQFVTSAKLGVRAGFDMVELHMAHGYLLASFLSPLTNLRQDQYGGSLENRLRFPLALVRAVRAVLPEAMPLSVRISACDWAQGGLTDSELVVIARALHQAGADIIDVSSGQTVPWQKPVYGRMYQTPFSDLIRNTAGVPTIAVGNIYEPDHVNSIIAAGRADLCAIARPHLANPSWTLEAAAGQQYDIQWWPQQYLSGKSQLERNLQRAALLAAAV